MMILDILFRFTFVSSVNWPILLIPNSMLWSAVVCAVSKTLENRILQRSFLTFLSLTDNTVGKVCFKRNSLASAFCPGCHLVSLFDRSLVCWRDKLVLSPPRRFTSDKLHTAYILQFYLCNVLELLHKGKIIQKYLFIQKQIKCKQQKQVIYHVENSSYLTCNYKLFILFIYFLFSANGEKRKLATDRRLPGIFAAFSSNTAQNRVYWFKKLMLRRQLINTVAPLCMLFSLNLILQSITNLSSCCPVPHGGSTIPWFQFSQ